MAEIPQNYFFLPYAPRFMRGIQSKWYLKPLDGPHKAGQVGSKTKCQHTLKRSNKIVITYLYTIIASLSITPFQTLSAGTMGELPPQADYIYFSVFGGGGGATSAPIKQKGTSFFALAARPVDVNARGTSNANSAWILGGQVGYQWLPRPIKHVDTKWSISPATELEGYYIGHSTFKVEDKDNNLLHIPEHKFQNTFPLDIGVFLINAVLHMDNVNWEKVHPYIGAGIGSAVTAISNATSFQTDPPEPNINHFNSDPNASSVTFAAQPKVGMTYILSDTIKIFAEYRLLILASGNYFFGSTVRERHNATTEWTVSIGSHFYNLGTVGIRYDI
ncbi:MAG: outer membrane beta-barrel protein [Legionellaceae bacterium]|nr:outer membrane beta-barrel protein [Legionellaceae bacterium]